jgi:hypothetical protein
MNLPLDDRVVAALSAKAAARGLTIDAYLEAIALSGPTRSATHISPDDLDRLLDEEATVGPSPAGTFTRAELYRDHD